VEWFKSLPEKIYLGFTENPYFAGKAVGEIAAGEVMGRVAGVVGKAAGKAVETVKFANKEFIPMEKLTQKGIVEGKYGFPLPKKIGSGKAIVEQFYESTSTKHTDIGKISKVSGFHATPSAGGIRGLGKGATVHSKISRPRDMPGMYIAPDVSPHFLRIAEETKYTLLPRLPSFKKPGILQIGLEAVQRIPEDVRYNIQKAQEWMRTKAEKGKAYITAEAELGKPEAEAIITPGTKLENIRGKGLFGGKFKYYTEWKGKKIPIYELKAIKETGKEIREVSPVKEGKLTKEIKEVKTFKEFTEEYGLKPETRWIGRDILRPATAGAVHESFKPNSEKSKSRIKTEDIEKGKETREIENASKEILKEIDKAYTKASRDIGIDLGKTGAISEATSILSRGKTKAEEFNRPERPESRPISKPKLKIKTPVEPFADFKFFEDLEKNKQGTQIDEIIQTNIERPETTKIKPSEPPVIKPPTIKPTIIETPIDGTKEKTQTEVDVLIETEIGEIEEIKPKNKKETEITIIDISTKTKTGTNIEIKPKTKTETEITIDIPPDLGEKTIETGTEIIPPLEDELTTILKEIINPPELPPFKPPELPPSNPPEGPPSYPPEIPIYPPPPKPPKTPPPKITETEEDIEKLVLSDLGELALGEVEHRFDLEQAVKKNPIVDDPLSVEIDIDFDIDLFGGGKKRSKRRKRR